MDEGLEILNGLWKGQPFSYKSQHYDIRPTQFPPPPPPVQQPRIPIWMVGAWPYQKSMERVSKCDGWLVAKMDEDKKYVEFTPADLREMKADVESKRTLTTPFDFIVEGTTKDASETVKVRAMGESGATWWIESMWGKEEAEVLTRLRQGPPK